MEGNMNYYYENPDPGFDTQQPQMVKPNGMATAALVLGICSLVFICCGGSFVFGALGIILALLSRGASEMHGNAKAGLILSIIGFTASIVIFIFTFIALLSSNEFTDIMEDYQYFYENGDEYDNYEIDEDYLNQLLEQYEEGGEL